MDTIVNEVNRSRANFLRGLQVAAEVSKQGSCTLLAADTSSHNYRKSLWLDVEISTVICTWLAYTATGMQVTGTWPQS